MVLAIHPFQDGNGRLSGDFITPSSCALATPTSPSAPSMTVIITSQAIHLNAVIPGGIASLPRLLSDVIVPNEVVICFFAQKTPLPKMGDAPIPFFSGHKT